MQWLLRAVSLYFVNHKIFISIILCASFSVYLYEREGMQAARDRYAEGMSRLIPAGLKEIRSGSYRIVVDCHNSAGDFENVLVPGCATSVVLFNDNYAVISDLKVDLIDAGVPPVLLSSSTLTFTAKKVLYSTGRNIRVSPNDTSFHRGSTDAFPDFDLSLDVPSNVGEKNIEMDVLVGYYPVTIDNEVIGVNADLNGTRSSDRETSSFSVTLPVLTRDANERLKASGLRERFRRELYGYLLLHLFLVVSVSSMYGPILLSATERYSDYWWQELARGGVKERYGLRQGLTITKRPSATVDPDAWGPFVLVFVFLNVFCGLLAGAMLLNWTWSGSAIVFLVASGGVTALVVKVAIEPFANKARILVSQSPGH